MKNVILFIVCSFFISAISADKMLLNRAKNDTNIEEKPEPQSANKVKTPNINEILWLWHKYKIRRIYSHCLMSETERKAQNDQQNQIFLKHGNLFWGTVNNEVDSIERNNLGYKKATLSDLDRFLRLKKCAIKNTPTRNVQIAGLWVNLNLNAEGKIASFDLDSYGYPSIHFGRRKCEEFNKYLTKVLTKAPLIKPSTFLNKGIEDRITQLYIMKTK
jgi:hypothetical protein